MSSPTLSASETSPPGWHAAGEASSEVPAGYERLVAAVAEGRPLDAGASRLVDEAAALWARPGFDTFMSLPRLGFEPFDYQLRAAERALRQMRGRAILADEVGLGKTIEAGLIASELRLRGLAARSLVVTPAGLVAQWQEELERKFALPSVMAAGAGWQLPDGAGDPPVVVASLAAARRAPLRDTLAEVPWDLVVVDEAHRVRRPRNASGRLARMLSSRYLLLLTATPVENRLNDLYQLVSLVRPGHLGTPEEFRARHHAPRGRRADRANGAGRPSGAGGANGSGANESGSDGSGANGSGPDGAAGERPDHAARDLPRLRARAREVMVRHRRSEVALMLPRRLAETHRVAPADDEAALYRDVSARVRGEARHAPSSRALQLRAVQRLAGSSPRALAPTLERLGWADLAARAAAVDGTAKARALTGLLRRHLDRGEKVVVFSGYRESLAFLAEVLAAAGIDAAVYHGSLTRRDKEAAVAAFADDTPVLLATEAAGEGRNLQFCHVMVNFDLPWNPMALEQRLGRLHRIGQTHEVTVTNFVTAGTIEERILAVLETKVNLFELVVGELDMILGRVGEDFDFAEAVFAAHVDSDDDAELAARLDELGDELAGARAAYLDTREQVDALAGGEDGETGAATREGASR